jgi:thiol:disulfide interchange protein
MHEWVADHPVRWGVAAGALFFIVGALNGLLVAAVVAAPLFGVLNWWIWRTGGPAHGWRAAILRRYPPRSH